MEAQLTKPHNALPFLTPWQIPAVRLDPFHHNSTVGGFNWRLLNVLPKQVDISRRNDLLMAVALESGKHLQIG